MRFHIQFMLYKLFKNLTLRKSHMHALKHTYIRTVVIFTHMQIWCSKADYIRGWSQSTDWCHNSPVSKGKPTTWSKKF